MLRMMTLSAFVLVATPVLAEEVTMSSAIAAGSLHEGPLDMVAYYRPIDGGSLEVTATFSRHDALTQPMRIVMAMQDGDKVAFAMPGYPEALYTFSRAGSAVQVAVDEEELAIGDSRTRNTTLITEAALAR